MRSDEIMSCEAVDQLDNVNRVTENTVDWLNHLCVVTG